MISLRCQAPLLYSSTCAPRESDGDDALAAAAVPIGDQDSVDEAVGHGNLLALPGAGTVHRQRRQTAIVGRAGVGGDQGREDEHLLAVAVDVGPADAVGGRKAIDLFRDPRVRRVAEMGEDRDDAGAVRRIHREAVRQRQLRNAVAVHVVGGDVDHLREPARDHVSRPGRILEPDQVAQLRGDRDEILFAVVVHVGDDDLIAASEVHGHGVGGEVRRVLVRRVGWSRRALRISEAARIADKQIRLMRRL